MSQVTEYCVVPPKMAMATAYTTATPPERIAAGNDSVSQITIGQVESAARLYRTAVTPSKTVVVRW